MASPLLSYIYRYYSYTMMVPGESSPVKVAEQKNVPVSGARLK